MYLFTIKTLYFVLRLWRSGGREEKAAKIRAPAPQNEGLLKDTMCLYTVGKRDS